MPPPLQLGRSGIGNLPRGTTCAARVGHVHCRLLSMTRRRRPASAATAPWLRTAASALFCLLLSLLSAVESKHKPRPPPPPLPVLPTMRTCAAGSPAASLSFCDMSRSHEERAALLAAELTVDEQIILWALHAYHYPIPRLNIKGLHRDTCCVHGPALNFMEGPWAGPDLQPKYVSVFPHAINHGATFDLELAELAVGETVILLTPLLPSILKRLMKGEGWCSKMTASPTARLSVSRTQPPSRCGRRRRSATAPPAGRPSPPSSATRARLAVGETVILLHPPLPLGRWFNMDGEGVPAK